MIIVKVNCTDILNALKKVNIAQSRSGSYTISFTNKMSGELNKCSIYCATEAIGALSFFLAKTGELKEGGKAAQLESIVTITIPVVFQEIIQTFSTMEADIAMIIENDIVKVTNSTSTVPINIIERNQLIGNPKNCEIIKVTIDKNELQETLKYIQPALYNKTVDYAYGIKPVYDEEGYLEILSMDSVTIASARIGIKKPKAEFQESCKRFVNYVNLDAGKINAIVSITDSIMEYSFYVDEKNLVRQVNIKVEDAVYQIKPFIRSYTPDMKKIYLRALEKNIFSVTVNAKKLKTAMEVVSLGKDQKKFISAQLSIEKLGSEETYLKIQDEEGESISKIKEFTFETENEDLPILESGVKYFLNAISPFDGTIKIGCSAEKGLITIHGSKEIPIVFTQRKK